MIYSEIIDIAHMHVQRFVYMNEILDITNNCSKSS